MHPKALPFGRVPLFVVTMIAVSTLRASSQGTIAAGNSALTRVTVDQDFDGNPDRNAIAADSLSVGFFYGPANSDPNQLILTATIGPTAGVLIGAPLVFPIEGTEASSFVSLRVRGWNSSHGTNWQTASNTPGAFFGETKVIQVQLGQTSGPGASIWQTASGTNPNRFTPLVVRIIPRPGPVGMPAFYVNGSYVGESKVVKRGIASVSMLTGFPNGRLFFTTDDSPPDLTSFLYRTPFSTRISITLRAIAYSADFSQSVKSDPLEIEIVTTTTATTEGGGNVAIQPPDGDYFSNRTATITATASPGWEFMQWLGDATGNDPFATVHVDRNRCVKAVFGTSFATSVTGNGSVITSLPGDRFPFGTQLLLTAVPDIGSYFVLWGNAANETNNPFNFTIQSANPEVTAVFAPLPDEQETLTVVPNGFGSVSISPRANRYLRGTNVTITATPQVGEEFLGWTGDAEGTSNPLVVTLNQSMVIGAEFTKHPNLTTAMCEGASTLGENKVIITGEIGDAYQIQSATKLEIPSDETEWTPLAAITNQFGTVQFNNDFATNAGSIIYRAILLP